MGGASEEQSRISTVDEKVFVAVRQHGWMCAQKRLWFACESAGNSTGGRAHDVTTVLCFVLLNSVMSARLIVETQKPRWNVSGIKTS